MASLAKGKPVYLPPRYMSIRQAVDQLLEVEAKRGEGACKPTDRAVGVARVGADTQQVVAGTLEELRSVDFGGPLHSLVVLGRPGNVSAHNPASNAPSVPPTPQVRQRSDSRRAAVC